MLSELAFLIDWLFIILFSLCGILVIVVVTYRSFWFFMDNVVPTMKSKAFLCVLILISLFLLLHYNGIIRYWMENYQPNSLFSITKQH